MFPLPINLVGLDDKLAPPVRRELLNQPAQLENEFADARQLLAQQRMHKNDPRLVITRVSGENDINDLRKINSALPGWPILALLDARNDSESLVRINRAGAGQIVPCPLDPRDFAEAVRTIGLQFGVVARGSTVIVVTGATGGCGATTLASTLGAETASVQQLHSILIELAMQMGVAATYLDVEPRVTLPDLLRDLARVDAHLVQSSLTRVADNFDLLSGPQEFSSPMLVSADDVFHVVEQARRLAEVILLDVPCNYGDMQFEVLARADHVVLVGEQTIPSVRALKLMIDSIRAGRDETGLTVVINRYDPELQGFTAQDLARLLRVPRLETVELDSAVKMACNQGRPLRQISPRSSALRDVQRILIQLLGVDAPVVAAAPVAGSGLFARLVGAFRS